MGTEPNYVVSLIAPLPEAEANAVASRLSDRLGLPGDRLARLLARRAGAITKPLSREAAARIAATLEDAGVPVLVERVVEPERSTSTRWIGFDPSDVSDEAFNAGWAQPRPNRAAQAPRPEISSGRDDASSRRSRPLVTSSRYSRPPPDEEPMFDWNQPIGYARWRRPAMLIALLVAIGIFVLLQVSGSTPQPTAKSAGAYEGGLAAYRLGDFRRALQVWEDVGSTGDARALYMLGYMSEFGQGQEWSNRRAAEYYRQAAERGSARAQFALASL